MTLSENDYIWAGTHLTCSVTKSYEKDGPRIHIFWKGDKIRTTKRKYGTLTLAYSKKDHLRWTIISWLRKGYIKLGEDI